MHVQGLLHNMLFTVMHKKRLTTLILLVMTALMHKKLSLTALGREIELPIQERSAIRRVDRFLGNKKLEQESIHKILTRRIIGNTKRPLIIADWSNIPNTTHNTLRASAVADGRALTLYEEVHPEKKLGNKKVQRAFLQKLKKLLPSECNPIILTDAGYHNDWFKDILDLDWDFIGRVRGKKYFRKGEEEWQLCSSLHAKASSTPRYLGEVELAKSNPLKIHLCLYKGKFKKRKAVNKAGKKRKDSASLDYRRAAKEPWVLATSLPKSYFLAKSVVKKYSTRMQIEEGFRDLKSSQYGFGFEKAYSKVIARIEVLLLIGSLASFIAWLVGLIAEEKGLHFQFQSNTIKNRRVLSLFYLGCQVIKKKIEISMCELETAINGSLCYAT